MIDWNELLVAADWYRERGNDLYADILEECAERKAFFNGNHGIWEDDAFGYGRPSWFPQEPSVSRFANDCIYWACDNTVDQPANGPTFETWRDHFGPAEYDCEDCEDSGEVDCSDCRGTGEGWPGGTRCGSCRGGVVDCDCQGVPHA